MTMKLMRVGSVGQERPAVLHQGRVLDVSAHVEDVSPAFFASDGISRLRQVVEERASELPGVDLARERIGAPISRPYKVVCAGLNYADHARESGMDVPSEPVIFFKASSTVVGPNDTVLLPRGGEKTDWEVELGVVIGRGARYLQDESAAVDAIAGYCVSNDVSERAFQLERGGQWVKGKSCETFNPLGHWLVTRTRWETRSRSTCRCDSTARSCRRTVRPRWSSRRRTWSGASASSWCSSRAT